MVIADAHAVLAVAAESRELESILKRCVWSRRLPWGLEFAMEARMGERRVVLAAHGAGPKLAGQAADVAARHERFGAVVSTGVCGALDPALEPGEIFVATRVEALEAGVSYEAAVPVCGRRYRTGPLVSVDRVVRTAEEKRRLHGLGAGAVEMEAAAVAARARDWGVPFFCVRAVSDLGREDLLLDYNAARGSEGRFSTRRIICAAMRRPLVLAPELWRMYRRSRQAALALGDFFAECSF